MTPKPVSGIEVYEKLTEDREGVYGSITARAAAQVMRIASIYAILDEKAVIERATSAAGVAAAETRANESAPTLATCSWTTSISRAASNANTSTTTATSTRCAAQRRAR